MNRSGVALGAAMLIGGPIAAGFTGTPVPNGLVFALVFALYLILFRPGKMPHLSELTRPESLQKLVFAALIAATLALAFTLLGSLLRGAIGVTQMLPIWPWIALSLAGIAVARQAIGPWAEVDLDRAEAHLDALQDRIDAKMQALSETVTRDLPPTLAPNIRRLERLDAFPAAGRSEDAFAKVLAGINTAELANLLPHLQSRAKEPGVREADLRAYAHAALQENTPQTGDWARDAFEAIFDAGNAEALTATIALARDLTEALPERYTALPTPARLVQIADQLEAAHGDLADDLVALADRIENHAEAQ